jgi:hypothetical protein
MHRCRSKTCWGAEGASCGSENTQQCRTPTTWWCVLCGRADCGNREAGKSYCGVCGERSGNASLCREA